MHFTSIFICISNLGIRTGVKWENICLHIGNLYCLLSRRKPLFGDFYILLSSSFFLSSSSGRSFFDNQKSCVPLGSKGSHGIPCNIWPIEWLADWPGRYWLILADWPILADYVQLADCVQLADFVQLAD